MIFCCCLKALRRRLTALDLTHGRLTVIPCPRSCFSLDLDLKQWVIKLFSLLTAPQVVNPQSLTLDIILLNQLRGCQVFLLRLSECSCLHLLLWVQFQWDFVTVVLPPFFLTLMPHALVLKVIFFGVILDFFAVIVLWFLRGKTCLVLVCLELALLNGIC